MTGESHSQVTFLTKGPRGVPRFKYAEELMLMVSVFGAFHRNRTPILYCLARGAKWSVGVPYYVQGVVKVQPTSSLWSNEVAGICIPGRGAAVGVQGAVNHTVVRVLHQRAIIQAKCSERQ